MYMREISQTSHPNTTRPSSRRVVFSCLNQPRQCPTARRVIEIALTQIRGGWLGTMYVREREVG